MAAAGKGLIDSLLLRQKAATPQTHARGSVAGRAAKPKERAMVETAWEREFAARQAEFEMEREQREQEILMRGAVAQPGAKPPELEDLLLRFSKLSTEAERVAKGRTVISKQHEEVRPPPPPVTAPMTLVEAVLHRRTLRAAVPIENRADPAYRHEQYLRLLAEGELAQMGVPLLNSKANVQNILQAYQDVSRKAVLDELAQWGAANSPLDDLADLGDPGAEAAEVVRTVEIDDDVQQCDAVDHMLENARAEQEELVERTKGLTQDLQQLTVTIADLHRQQEQLQRPVVDAGTNTNATFEPSETVFMTIARPEDKAADRPPQAAEAAEPLPSVAVAGSPRPFTGQPLMDWLVKSEAGLDRLYQLCMGVDFGVLRRQDALFYTHLLHDKNDRMTRQRSREEHAQTKLRHLIVKLREQLVVVRQELDETQRNSWALGFTEDLDTEDETLPDPVTSNLVEDLRAEMAQAEARDAALLAQARNELQHLRDEYSRLCQELADSEKNRVVLLREFEEAKVQLKLLSGSLESRDLMLRDNETRSRAALQRMETMQHEEEQHQKSLQELEALLRLTREQMSHMVSPADVEAQLLQAHQEHLAEVRTLTAELHTHQAAAQEAVAARSALQTRFKAIEEELATRNEEPSAQSFDAVAATLVAVSRQQAEVLGRLRQCIVREVPDLATNLFEASTAAVKGLAASLKACTALDATAHQQDLRTLISELQRESGKLFVAAPSSRSVTPRVPERPEGVPVETQTDELPATLPAPAPPPTMDKAQSYTPPDESPEFQVNEVEHRAAHGRLHAMAGYVQALTERWNANLQQADAGDFSLSTRLVLPADKAHPFYQEMCTLELMSQDLFRLVMRTHRRKEFAMRVLLDALCRGLDDRHEGLQAQGHAIQRSLNVLRGLETTLCPVDPAQPLLWPALAWRFAILQSKPLPRAPDPLTPLSPSTSRMDVRSVAPADVAGRLHALQAVRGRQAEATALHAAVLDALAEALAGGRDRLFTPVSSSPLVPPLPQYLPDPALTPTPTPPSSTPKTAPQSPRSSARSSARGTPSQPAEAVSSPRHATPRAPAEASGSPRHATPRAPAPAAPPPRRPPPPASASASRRRPPPVRTAPYTTVDRGTNTVSMSPEGPGKTPETQALQLQLTALKDALEAHEEQLKHFTSRQYRTVATYTHEERHTSAVPLAAVAAACAVLAARRGPAPPAPPPSGRSTEAVQFALRKMGHAYDTAQLTLAAMDQLLRCVQPEGQPEAHVLLRRGADFLGSARRVVDGATPPSQDASLRAALQSLTAILPGCRLRLVADDVHLTVPTPDEPAAPLTAPLRGTRVTPPRPIRPSSPPALAPQGVPLPKAMGELLRLKGQGMAGDQDGQPKKSSVITLPRVSLANDLWQNPLGTLFWQAHPAAEPDLGEASRAVLPHVLPTVEPLPPDSSPTTLPGKGRPTLSSPPLATAARPTSGFAKLPPALSPGGVPNARHGATKPLPRANRVILPLPSPADED